MTVLSNVEPWDMIAEGYANTATDLFRAFGHAALECVDVAPGARVLDIACGPGSLSTLLAARGAEVTALDFSPGMLAQLAHRVDRESLTGITPCLADGQDMPFGDGVFDVAFSLFGLMFFPDRARGFAEALRTLRPGGTLCVSSWSRPEDSPLFVAMARAIHALDPSLPEPGHDITSLENPDRLSAEMSEAGFRGVAIHRVERALEVATAEDLWAALVAGSAPVAVIKARMPGDIWARRSADALSVIRSEVGRFPARLGAVGWIGTGRAPGG